MGLRNVFVWDTYYLFERELYKVLNFYDTADENMAHSQSRVVTFAAGSALLVGVIFTIYLIRRRRRFFDGPGKMLYLF